jgi:hypothetical protein
VAAGVGAAGAGVGGVVEVEGVGAGSLLTVTGVCAAAGAGVVGFATLTIGSAFATGSGAEVRAAGRSVTLVSPEIGVGVGAVCCGLAAGTGGEEIATGTTRFGALWRTGAAWTTFFAWTGATWATGLTRTTFGRGGFGVENVGAVVLELLAAARGDRARWRASGSPTRRGRKATPATTLPTDKTTTVSRPTLPHLNISFLRPGNDVVAMLIGTAAKRL